MSGCHSTEVKKCDCLCHNYNYPADYDFTGSVCCGCHQNKLRLEPILTMHPTQELVDKFDDRIKRIEDFHIRNFSERIESLESQMKASTEMYKHLSISIAVLQGHHVRQIDENRKISSRVDDVIKEIVNQSSIAEKYSIDYESRIKKLEDNIIFNVDNRRDLNASLISLQQLFENRLDMFKKYIESVDKHSSQNEGHCIGLESRIEKLEENLKIDDRISASDVLCRLTKLESDHLDKLNPHAFLILKKRCDELERLINAIKDSYNNICAPSLRKEPFKCPVCEGKGKDSNRLVTESCDQQIKVLVNPDCKSCEGKGIVWG